MILAHGHIPKTDKARNPLPDKLVITRKQKRFGGKTRFKSILLSIIQLSLYNVRIILTHAISAFQLNNDGRKNGRYE